jgi:uncharacterized membrane protein
LGTAGMPAARGKLMKRYIVLYIATLLVLAPLDAIWLGVVARGFFKAQLGDMLGDLNALPAVLFYLMYVTGIMVFANGADGATWRSALGYGLLFGFFAYATYDLTNLAILRHWSWPAAVVDIAWGSFVTGVASAIGLLVADALAARAS